MTAEVAEPLVASEAAPGKVNLGLAVLARRGDGFHEIETLFARLALGDMVEARLLPGRRGEVHLEVEADAYPGAPEWFARSVAELPTGVENIASRAASAYLAAAGPEAGDHGVALRLTKRLPVAAGLGGGSSDAAAVLRALGRLLPSAIEARELAAGLGSDVPFFAADVVGAIAKGRGERLTTVSLPVLDLVLAKPALRVSAGAAYEALVGFSGRLRHEASLAALAGGTDPGWRNGLQAGVMRRHADVRELLAQLRDAGLRGVLMSGSGPTCFGVASSAEAAADVAAELRARRPDLWVVATSAGGSSVSGRDA